MEINGAGVALAPCWELETTGAHIQGLVINRCRDGALYDKGSLTVTGNFFGTTPAGTPLTDGSPQGSASSLSARSATSRPSRDRRRPAPADRNLISGQSVGRRHHQYNVAGAIQGNLIGTDATVSYVHLQRRRHRLPFAASGSRSEAREPNEGNVIGGSLAEGFAGLFSTFQGNFVGTNPSQTVNLGNLGSGVVFSTTGSAVRSPRRPRTRGRQRHRAQRRRAASSAIRRGSSCPAGARSPRGATSSTTTVPWPSVSDLDPPHPADPGDGDTGPNERQNAPVITSIDYGPPTVAHACCSSAPSTTYDVDFYASTSCVLVSSAAPPGRGRASAHVSVDDRRLGTRDDRLHLCLAARPGRTRVGDRDGSSRQHVGVRADDPAEDDAALGPAAGGRHP